MTPDSDSDNDSDSDEDKLRDGLVNAMTAAIEGQLDGRQAKAVAIIRLDPYTLVLLGLIDVAAGSAKFAAPVWSIEISNHAAMQIVKNLLGCLNQVMPCKEHGVGIVLDSSDSAPAASVAPATAIGDETEALDVETSPSNGVDLL